MPGLVKDKVALVTGGGMGIGRATSLIFAREGAKIVVSDVDVGAGQETVRMIREKGGEALFVKTDVSKASDVEELVHQTVKTFKRLDCAFNNAGISIGAPGTLLCKEEEWDKMMNVNLKGVWLCMRSEIPEMIKQGGGAIVNTSSFAGLTASRLGLVSYSASKHGVVGLTKTAAVEFAKQGVRINAVCPGATRTPMLEAHISGPQDEEELASLNPIHRIGSPAEIGETVVWLCSDAASFVTGVAMPVDGGQILL